MPDSKLTEEARAAIADAIRIVREDKFEQFVRATTKTPDPITPPVDPKVAPTDPKGPPAPPPKGDDPPPEKRKGLWWREDDEPEGEPSAD